MLVLQSEKRMVWYMRSMWCAMHVGCSDAYARIRRYVVCMRQQSNMWTGGERTEQFELCLSYDNILIDIFFDNLQFLQVTNYRSTIITRS